MKDDHILKSNKQQSILVGGQYDEVDFYCFNCGKKLVYNSQRDPSGQVEGWNCENKKCLVGSVNYLNKPANRWITWSTKKEDHEQWLRENQD